MLNLLSNKAMSPALIRKYADQINAVSTPEHLSKLIGVERFKLELQASKPAYNTYHIPKKSGGIRLIEDPHLPLKNVLKKLNYFFQTAYYTVRPAGVYGFCISSRNEEDRNIISNAKKHLHRQYMLNIDMRDFFYSVTENILHKTIQAYFPNLKSETCALIIKLTTYKGRLPMGSPCSPVLSNFAFYAADAELENYCKTAGITFTRYADDLTFSSNNKIKNSDEKFFRNTINYYGFNINENKVKYFNPADTKVITGLLVSDTVSLNMQYIPQLQEEINRLKTTMLVEQRYKTGLSFKKLKLFIQELNGKINFATMVLGKNSPEIIQLEEQFEDAKNPAIDFISENWLDVPYNF